MLKALYSFLTSPKTTYYFSIAAFISMCFLYIIYISISNSLANDGLVLAALQKETETLTMENQILQDEIATQSSLHTIEPQARGLGFKPIEKVIYIK